MTSTKGSQAKASSEVKTKIAPGIKVGDYEILREIGSDFLSTQYLAKHHYLKRLYVLKALPQEFSNDDAFIARFEEEMSYSGLLEHSHIVRMHNATSMEGTFFVVSAAHGDSHHPCLSLDAFLKSGREVTESQIYEIATQLASALDYAHKPSSEKPSIPHGAIRLKNILIEESGTNVHVRLDNFGLMRVLGTQVVLNRMYALFCSTCLHAEEEKNLRREFLTDFTFLAPEQRIGENTLTSEIASDVYAFGVLVYYLLMKKLPEGYFPLPSTRYPSSHYNWDRLLISCLQTEKEKRPESLRQALKELTVPKSILPSLVHELKNVKTTDLKPVLNPGEITRPEFDADPAAQFIVDPTIGRYQPEPTDVASTEPLLTPMVVIQGGQYWRGSQQGGRDEIPRHCVTISSFAMDIFPVTNEQFVRFLEVMGGEKDANNNDMIRLRDSRIKRSGGRINIESGYAKHPVVGVSWYGAVAYAKWVGKRLPTEAEWEIACIGGVESNIYPTGKNIERSQANFFSSDTTAVMSYPANTYGLYDMAGNVYEWCNDWYEFHYYDVSVQEPLDPQGPLQGNYRVLRGGCWKSLKDDLRAAHRHRNNPGTMNGTYGFRCAADVST